jgi:hypothetical protein
VLGLVDADEAQDRRMPMAVIETKRVAMDRRMGAERIMATVGRFLPRSLAGKRSRIKTVCGQSAAPGIGG